MRSALRRTIVACRRSSLAWASASLSGTGGGASASAIFDSAGVDLPATPRSGRGSERRCMGFVNSTLELGQRCTSTAGGAAPQAADAVSRIRDGPERLQRHVDPAASGGDETRAARMRDALVGLLPGTTFSPSPSSSLFLSVDALVFFVGGAYTAVAARAGAAAESPVISWL